MSSNVTKALNEFLKREGKPPVDRKFWGDIVLKYEAGEMVFAEKKDKIQLRKWK